MSASEWCSFYVGTHHGWSCRRSERAEEEEEEKMTKRAILAVTVLNVRKVI